MSSRAWRLTTFCLLCLSAGAAADRGDADGALLAASCQGCHLAGALAGANEAMPDISGLSQQTIAALLQSFKDDRRPGTVMTRIAKGYSDAEILQIAHQLGNKAP